MGDISAWFIKTLAGINYNPSGLNCTEVSIAPKFADVLQNAKGYYESPYGKIISSWERNVENISLYIEIPNKMTAMVYLPMGYSFKDEDKTLILKEGKYNIVVLEN